MPVSYPFFYNTITNPSLVFENFKWLLLMTVFLGGLSLHISQALVSHFLGIDMSWGATAKEIEDVDFFKEFPSILNKFKWTIAFCLVCTAIILSCKYALPWEWAITDFVAIYPLVSILASHFFLPIVLNPGIMQFSY